MPSPIKPSLKQTVKTVLPGPNTATMINEFSWRANYIFPVAVKKSFRFPLTLSPYVLIGASYYQARLVHQAYYTDSIGGSYSLDGGADRTGIAPMVGGGIELYPARLVRPRLDARWFTGPPTKVRDKTMRADQLFLSLSVLTAW